VEVHAPVLDSAGRQIGSLLLAQLPGRSYPLRSDGRTPEVVEGGDYRYAIELDHSPTRVVLEPGDELFSFDAGSCLTGRFQPRQHVGRLRIGVEVPDSAASGVVELEVAPTKLEYASEYQQMLTNVAAVATEALIQGFAPASLALAQDPRTRPRLLYQQFAFLHARLASREVRDALALVTANPHRAWRTETELQLAGRPLPGSSLLSRTLAKPGSRVRTSGRLRVASVPRVLDRTRTESTFDSVPNRFVKYALLRWRTITQQLLDALGATADQDRGPLRRGLRVARQVRGQLDEVLATPFFSEVGGLDVFPSANQVLHKREGYRQIFQTFALTEVGASLSLDWDIDDVFAATQRNVATLYEYWAFLQLVQAMGAVCGEERTVEALARAGDGLSLGFKQGTKSGVRWEPDAAGRRLEVEVFFNRTFASSPSRATDSSWSRAMRPDCSVRVRPKTQSLDVEAGSMDLWLHFDAKYRVERAREQFDSQTEEAHSAAGEAEATERLSGSRREDLLKMHAYRDAIRRSAGAYVLFPGNQSASPFREFTEPLPGLGAFVLRPSDEDDAHGSDVLQEFLGEVLAHVADRASQYERDRFWQAVVRSREPDVGRAERALPSLRVPPRDATVLCAFVRGRDVFEWVVRNSTFIVPGDQQSSALSVDASELHPEWLVLYSSDMRPSLWFRDRAWYVQLRDDLITLGYPEVAGTAYLSASVSPVSDAPEWIADIDVDALRKQIGSPRGRPFVATWADLISI
jgi:uncharacterized protein